MKPHRGRQSGAALLALVFVVVAASTYLLVLRLNAATRPYLREQRSITALQEAKQALIAYAVTYIDSHPGELGFLPCPDKNPTINPEGTQDPNCGVVNANSLGRLPWKSLGLPPLRDSAGECLWYAVSGAYKEGSTKAKMLNEDSYGTFEIFAKDGVTKIAGNEPADRALAVIIAPGLAMGSQDRAHTSANSESCKGNHTAENYMESLGGIENHTASAAADTMDPFVQGSNESDAAVNDVLVFIRAREIFERIRKRNDYANMLYEQSHPENLALKITQCLADYGNYNKSASVGNNGVTIYDNQSLPWPAPVDLDDYRDSSQYDDKYIASGAIVLSGRLPIYIGDSNSTIGNGAPNDLITYCKVSPSWVALTAEQRDFLETLWLNWKDHLFYSVSQRFQPLPLVSDTQLCSSGIYCITLDSPAGSDWAGIVFFSGEEMSPNSRPAPPIDADGKSVISNYLEELNTGIYKDGDNNIQYTNAPVSGSFNDVLYCINDHDNSDGIPTFQAGKCP